VDYLVKNITTAGAFLVGHMTATSLGDFLAGPSHVLPTGRSSRFSSGLRLHDFLRRSSFIKYDKDSSVKAAPALKVFAEMEKLDGHGRSFSIRL
jgi:histidinol dehydrogenase